VLAGGSALGCDRSGPAQAHAGGAGGGFTVVAAENVWGSIAAQLAGDRATVRSVITEPATDPHSYEPTASDARAIATANMAIVNGLGYDRWASQLLAASPAPGRVVLDVGSYLGLSSGANPHRWYYPADVLRVVGAISARYERIDPADRAYFAQRERWFLSRALAGYDRLLARIRSRFAGVPVGYSESIFQGLGEDLRLRLLTPPGFVKAVAEGTDITAQDKRTVDEQLERRRVAVWVYNSQNVTPDVQRVTEIARARGIPVVPVTETLSPRGASFQQWQSSQLGGLLAVLQRVAPRAATGP
jgi:zinc/manganese transport system substrate-binding protein